MDDQLSGHQTRHQDYTDQLKKLNLKDNCNRYIITYKIDHHHNLFKSLNTRQCLLSVFYIWLFSYSLLISVVNSQILTSSTQTQNPSHNQSPRTVATKYGILRGTIITLPNVNLQQVEAFLGIPYAQPPTGKLRLMPPVTSAHWPGIKDADRIAAACPQPMPPQLSTFKKLDLINQTSEDCLYLNIYSPISVHQHAVRLPVMVYIHGGDFESGSGSDYDGSVLASYGNVIVVTLNYRLGLLGFFPTRDGTARGNYGLMDQVAALHWLQENIIEFGGLSSNVTVFGSGSGAACIQLLMISPMARGLFQRAILMSGSGISPQYSASTLNTLRNAKQIAAQLQCFQASDSRHSSVNQFNKEKDYKETFKDNYSKDKQNIEKSNNKEHKSSELLECLRKQKLDKLMDLQVRQPQFLFKYSPTLEGLLLPIDPIKVMSDKQSTFLQYDLMIGVNSAPLNEFYNLASSQSLTNEPLLTDVNNGGKSNSISSFITEERKEKIIRTLVRNLYTYHLQEIYMTLSNEYHSYTNTSIDEETKLVELLNDALLIAPSITTALLHSKSQSKSTFVYNYAALNQLDTNDYYQQHKTIQTKTLKDQLKNQTTINEELSMIFGQPLVPSMKLIQRSNKRNYSNLEVKLSEKLMHYWTHFAKTGDPNIQQQMNSVHHHNYHSQSTLNNNMNNNLNNLINNNNNLKDTNYSSLNEHLQKTRTEHWPNFNDYTQLYLNLNLHPTVHDHMRSHQVSFFSKLIPKLNRPIANNMQMNEHHLLEDHHNLATYEGIVREHPAAGLMRNIALDLEDQLASKRMLELLLNGEKQLSEQSNDEKSKLNNLMKLREKLLKWKFISEQSNMETQQNFDDLIRKLTSRIEGGSNTNLLTRNNSSIIIEMDNTQDNGQELINNNLNQINQQDQLNSHQQEHTNEQQKNSDDEQEDNTIIQQNLKQINSPSTNSQQPKLNDELNYQLHHNANESYSMIIQDGQYSTALSVTIIVGCSLLFLNILVFLGVYIQRSNRRSNTINNQLNQSANNSLLNSINNDNILNNSGLLVNNQNTNTLNGQQLKAYQANQSIYLPCCEYDQTNQQQCNATILTLKRNNSNKTYIAKTSTTCGQLKNSIENDYYLQQQQQQQSNYLDEHHLNLNNMSHNSSSIYNTINKINDINNTQTTFDQTNDTIILDKQNSTKLQQQQQIDYLTVDGSLGLSSGIGSLENSGVSQTLSQNISNINNSINNTNNTNNTLNNKLNQITNLNDLSNEHHHLFNIQQQQQLNNNNVDLVNVSCSSAVSSSSAATLITSSPANTSTPDYYQQQKNSTNLHHSTLLNNQLNSQFNNQTNYLQHQQLNDQIQGLYGHQTTNQYVQLTNLTNSNYPDNTLNEIDQQSKLLNTNHCNIMNCSIAQCDCTSTIYKDTYSNAHLDKMMESSN